MLVIISDREGNIYDQRGIELKLAEDQIFSIRRTFDELEKTMIFDSTTGKLFVYSLNSLNSLNYKNCIFFYSFILSIYFFASGNDEIFLVYFRWGYQEQHYTNKVDILYRITYITASLKYSKLSKIILML